MKSALKVLMWVGLILVIVLIGLSIWVTVFLDLNKHKPRIAKLIHKHSGYEVHLNGDISWSLYPSLGLSLAEVEVLDKDNPGNMLLDLKALHLSLDTSALRRHEIKVTDILVKGLDLRLIYGGAPAQTQSVVAEPAPENKVAHDKKEKTDKKSSIAGESQETGDSDQEFMNYLSKAEIEKVLIENSNIFLIDKTTNQSYALTAVRLETAHIRLGSPIDFSLSTRFTMPNQKSMNVNLVTRLFMEHSLAKIQLDPFKLIIDQDIFEGHFSLDKAATPWKFVMALNSQEFDWSRFLKDSKQQMIMKDIHATTNLSFNLNKVDVAKSLEGDIILTSGELSFNGASLSDKAKQLIELRQMFVSNQASLADLVSKAKSITKAMYTPSKSTVMNKFKMKGMLKDTILKADLEAVGDQYLFFGNGTLAFDQTIDFKLFLGLPEQQDKNLPTLVIPLKIKGKVSDPDVSLSEKELLDQVDVIMRARLNDEVQQKIKAQASGFLKKFGQ